MYILLRFVNEYYQEGGYFAGVFTSLKAAQSSVNHIGRLLSEDEWYRIAKVKEGEVISYLEEDSDLILPITVEGA